MSIQRDVRCNVEEEIKNLDICERFSAGLLLSAAVGSKLAGEWERLTILKPTCLSRVSIYPMRLNIDRNPITVEDMGQHGMPKNFTNTTCRSCAITIATFQLAVFAIYD